MYNLQRGQFNYDPESQLILRKGEKFERYMNPFLYLRKNHLYLDSDLLKKEIVNQLQVALHNLLESYLNSFFLPAMPLNIKHTKRFKDKLNALHWYFLRLNDLKENAAFLPAISLYRSYLSKNALSRRQVSSLISISYRLLHHILGKVQSNGKRSVKIGKIFSKDIYKHPVYQPIIDLWKYTNDKLRDYLVDFLLHGSYSTLDHCAYSDLDTLIIIKQEVVENESKLYEFQNIVRKTLRFLYLVDPLQHHGHFFITQCDLDYFPETFFPLPVFEYSTSFVQNEQNRLLISIRNGDLESSSDTWKICYSFRELYFRRALPQALYDLKVYLSKLMLLPALYLQVKGESCYKKHSFKKAKAHFSATEWKVIEESSSIRENWELPSCVKLSYRLPISFGLHPILVSRLANIICRRLPTRIEEHLTESFFDRATLFSESIISRLSERYHG